MGNICRCTFLTINDTHSGKQFRNCSGDDCFLKQMNKPILYWVKPLDNSWESSSSLVVGMRLTWQSGWNWTISNMLINHVTNLKMNAACKLKVRGTSWFGEISACEIVWILNTTLGRGLRCVNVMLSLEYSGRWNMLSN